jgi:DNA-binding HxlR family transcriptional regulator
MLMLGKDYAGQHCGLARALELVGERWTLLILRDAFFGVQRFSDFSESLQLSRGVLADRLRGLVDAGLLERRPDPDHAARSLYVLTESGRAVWPALHALAHWGLQFMDSPPPQQFIHDSCDAPLDAHGVCTACGHAPPPEAVRDVLTSTAAE